MARVEVVRKQRSDNFLSATNSQSARDLAHSKTLRAGRARHSVRAVVVNPDAVILKGLPPRNRWAEGFYPVEIIGALFDLNNFQNPSPVSGTDGFRKIILSDSAGGGHYLMNALVG